MNPTRYAAAVLAATLLAGASAAQEVTKDPLHKQAVAWLKANNSFGPASKLVRDMTEVVDEALEKGEDLSLTFGPGLMKSGKATIVYLFAGQFFAFELSAAQAQQLKVNSRGTRVYTTKREDRRQAKPAAQLSDLKFEGGATLEGSKKVTGQVSFRTLAKSDEKFALRFSYCVPGHNRSSFHYLDDGLPAKPGSIPFSFGAINRPDDKKKFTGPLVVFVDLVTVKEKGGNVEITTYSNTIGKLVDVK
jgi:hypothetical protein